MDLVSVIIPYYKKRNYVKETVLSVINQSYGNFEIIIIYDDTNLNDFEFLQKIAKLDSRINILKNSNDGFEISEEDMKLRGYGDILGFKQSGVKKFKIADPILHRDLFELAEEEINKIEQNNSKLGEYYKLLKLYDRADILNDIV